MRRIMLDERREHPIDLGFAAIAALGGDRPFDHSARPAADHPPRGVVIHRRQTLSDEDQVERRNEIGRGINQGAVEIKDDGQHGLSGKADRSRAQGSRLDLGRRLHTA